MKSPELESKRIFLLAGFAPPEGKKCQELIEEHIGRSTVFIASDSQEALFKADNVPPHVAIVDGQGSREEAIELTRKLFNQSKENPLSIILILPTPDEEHFVDEVVTGHVQFLDSLLHIEKFVQCLMRAMNAVSVEDKSTYHLKFLSPGDVLFRESEIAKCVYIVRKGELEALKEVNGVAKVLGKILPGEFVGEMAHFNSENRSATVKAIGDCELIEIPYGTLDLVLFSKPAWSKALIATLSRRLKNSNSKLG